MGQDIRSMFRVLGMYNFAIGMLEEQIAFISFFCHFDLSRASDSMNMLNFYGF